jgi:hypothetical protein
MDVEIMLDPEHFEPAVVSGLAQALSEHFRVRVQHQPTNGTKQGPRVVVTLPLPEIERRDRPTVANLLSRPLFRGLDAHLLRGEPRPALEFRFRFVGPERVIERRVITPESDVLKHAVDTLLEQLARPEPVLTYDERTGGWLVSDSVAPSGSAGLPTGE